MASARPKVSPELQKRLTSELGPGERLLYAAQPDWRAERGKLLAIFLFGLFWSTIAFAFFGISIAGMLGIAPINSGGKPASIWMMVFVLLFSLPFVAIGAACLAAPFLGIRKSRNTVHAVTDARLISVYGGRDAGAESHPLAKINFIERKDRSNGTGNLHIGYGVEKDSDGDPRPLTTDWSGIPDAKRAEAIIREQAKWVR